MRWNMMIQKKSISTNQISFHNHQKAQQWRCWSAFHYTRAIASSLLKSRWLRLRSKKSPLFPFGTGTNDRRPMENAVSVVEPIKVGGLTSWPIQSVLQYGRFDTDTTRLIGRRPSFESRIYPTVKCVSSFDRKFEHGWLDLVRETRNFIYVHTFRIAEMFVYFLMEPQLFHEEIPWHTHTFHSLP